MEEQDPISPADRTRADSEPAADAASDAQLGADLLEPSSELSVDIPSEEPAPMIDIHPPGHAPMTRRDFFVHLFIVVLGILIAIGLEQAVEYLHHRYLAAEAKPALRDERQQNVDANEFNIFATQHHERDLRHDLAMLDAVRAHRPVPPGPFILSHPTSLYNDEEWQNIHQTGAINYLGGDIAGGLRFRHTIEDKFADLSDRSYVDLGRAASVLRTSSDRPNHGFEQNMAFSDFFRKFEAAHGQLPQPEIDAAWATFAEPVNEAALSPAQIDSLERAIQIAIADDDLMLNACYTIKRNLVRNPGH